MRKDKQTKMTRSMMHELVHLIFEQDPQSPTSPADPKSELFEDKMAECLPEDFFDRSRLPGHLSALCDMSGLSKTETWKTIINNDKAELDLLIKIKDYFKTLLSTSRNETEHQIYTSIYYAAIASALLHHQERISSYSFEKLAVNYERLIKEVWLPEYILELYRKAQIYCRQKAKL